VKECYYYLDSTPTHSYMKALYKYPQAEFPYARLVEENRRRGKLDPEFRADRHGVFDDGRYFDVFVEYAKAEPDDILIRITVANRSRGAAALHLLPTLWFRTRGSGGASMRDAGYAQVFGRWGMRRFRPITSPSARISSSPAPVRTGPSRAGCSPKTKPTRGSCSGWTPGRHMSKTRSMSTWSTADRAVSPRPIGTKGGRPVSAGRPGGGRSGHSPPARGRRRVTACRPRRGVRPDLPRPTARGGRILRGPAATRHGGAGARHRAARVCGACCGASSFYHYIVRDWIEAIRSSPRHPRPGTAGRNADWPHLYNRDVISMPDKWEYPWYAAWDLAFHMIPFAEIDPEYAKQQLVLFLREWYMHPNGQLPAYEFNFGDCEPPRARLGPAGACTR